MTGYFIHSWVIARYSFKELLGERILYNICFVSLFLLFFGYLAALLVFGFQDRVMLHFGTMVNAISLYIVAAGAGARAVRSEVEQRTCYITLARPISRISYFYGKWLGIALFTALNLFLLTLILIIGIRITGGHESVAFFQSMTLIWVETLMVSSIALLLSLFLRPGLTIMITVAYLFLAHNHDQLEFLRTQGSDVGGLFSFIRYVTPDGSAMLLDTRVYYEFPLSLFEFLGRGTYGFLWALLFLIFGNALFYRKNL